jgi:hypothetical protein
MNCAIAKDCEEPATKALVSDKVRIGPVCATHGAQLLRVALRDHPNEKPKLVDI